MKEGITTNDEAIADLLGLLIGGMDTTASVLTQIFWRLKKHPEICQKLKEEISQNFPDMSSNPEDLVKLLTTEKLDDLDYLLCFIKECLRI